MPESVRSRFGAATKAGKRWKPARGRRASQGSEDSVALAHSAAGEVLIETSKVVSSDQDQYSFESDLKRLLWPRPAPRRRPVNMQRAGRRARWGASTSAAIP